MRELDGSRIIGSDDGDWRQGRGSRRRELVDASDTDRRWRLGEVVADPDDRVSTHVHPGEPEAIAILQGPVELHGANGTAVLETGDVIFIPPDVEHGLRTPAGGRWLAIWPVGERRPGPRYAARA